MTAMAIRPVMARAVYSGGAKPLAKSASTGARMISTTPPKRPPRAEDEIAMPMASPARPFWAMG